MENLNQNKIMFDDDVPIDYLKLEPQPEVVEIFKVIEVR